MHKTAFLVLMFSLCVCMENLDLYRLSAGEFTEKVINKELKADNYKKGFFYKAFDEKSGKTIYFLGTMHIVSRQYSAEIMNHIKKQLEKDNVLQVDITWVERTDMSLENFDAFLLAELREKNKFFKHDVLKSLDREWVIEKTFRNQKARTNEGAVIQEAMVRTNLLQQFALAVHARDYCYLAGKSCELEEWIVIINNLGKSSSRNNNDDNDVAKRNQEWVEQLLQENVPVQFVIAGASHAFYNTGLVMLLKNEGWKVEQIDTAIFEPNSHLEIEDQNVSSDETLYHIPLVPRHRPENILKSRKDLEIATFFITFYVLSGFRVYLFIFSEKNV